MRIFRYWAKEEEALRDELGNDVLVRAWGGDNASPDAARASARQRLAQWVAAFKSSWEDFMAAVNYPYEKELHEETLEGEFEAGTDRWLWAITRNRYGAQVLNTATLAILDLDRRPSSWWGWLWTLGVSRERLNRRVLRRLRTWLAVSPEIALRLYETPNGFRALLLHRPFDPSGEEIQKLMWEIGTDGLYARLCAVQGSFRARLTPKPWRVGLPRANWHPLDADASRKESDLAWLRRYEERSTGFAACRFVAHLGKPPSDDPDLARWVVLHDARSGALSGKPLA